MHAQYHDNRKKSTSHYCLWPIEFEQVGLFPAIYLIISLSVSLYTICLSVRVFGLTV